MNKMGAASSPCSYVYIKVNDEDLVFYFALENAEEPF